MADVGKVVNGRPAGIERELPRLAWNELDRTAQSSVMKGKHALQATTCPTTPYPRFHVKRVTMPGARHLFL